MHYLIKFDDAVWSSFRVIQKITSANLCKSIYDINHSTFFGPFKSGKYGKEGKKLQKLEDLENGKSFLDGIKAVSIVLEGLSLGKKQRTQNFKGFKKGYKNFFSIFQTKHISNHYYKSCDKKLRQNLNLTFQGYKKFLTPASTAHPNK